MFMIGADDIVVQAELLDNQYEEGLKSPLFLDKFMEKTFKRKAAGIQYPYTIKIPKSLPELLKGDITPAKEIVIDKPIMYQGRFPIWFGNSSKGINLHGFGYRNGDSRYPCSLALNDNTIHMLLGGATGQGKSVTLNSAIITAAFEYGPWDLKYTLLDAKIVEFKKYAAAGKVLPHIASIGATTDADYIISVLQDLRDEMLRVNAMFVANGCSNIIEFRKQTGLCFPQNLIVIDEFQTMFKNAQRKKKIIESIIDDFARLGRSTGYHLLMASQEPGDIPTETLGNITVRGALGCMPSISTKIVGNDEANMYLGEKGRLIINTSPGNQDKKDNQHYRVPYQPTEMFSDQLAFLSSLGDEFGFRYNLSFYDENTFMEPADLREFIKQRNRMDRIYLGEPSFVMRDEDGDNFVRMQIGGDDIENILVWCKHPNDVARYAIIVKENIKHMGSSVINNIIAADKNMVAKIGLEELSSKIYDGRDCEGQALTMFMQNMYFRKLALEVEQQVFVEHCGTSEQGNKLLSQSITDGKNPLGNEFDTEMNRSRAHAVLVLLNENTYKTAFGFGAGGSLSVDFCIDAVQYCLRLTASVGCSKQMMTRKHLAPIFNWIVGLEKVRGWGRDFKNAHVEKFKKVLQDCTSANIRFVMTTTSMDNLEGLSSGIRYAVLSGLTETQAKKVGAQEYPETVSSALGIYFDKYDEIDPVPVKFKKMIFEGEIVI